MAEEISEQFAQSLISAFESEASTKLDPKQWKSVDPDVFRMCINHVQEFAIEDVISHGTSELFWMGVRFSCCNDITEPTRQSLIRAFKRGFVWEVITTYSAPPKVAFQWRYWGTFEGLVIHHTPINQLIEIFGMTVATVDKDLKLTYLEHFFDTGQFLKSFSGYGGDVQPKHEMYEHV